jgi:D-3-phosphoglycerate dehydrogenase
MADKVMEALIFELLEWLAKRDRSYEEVMDAWRTSCPDSRFGRMRMIVDSS